MAKSKTGTGASQERSMTASLEAAAMDITKPCPICDHHMRLGQIQTVAWGPNACAERLIFRCEKCGVAQTQWNAIPRDMRVEDHTDHDADRRLDDSGRPPQAQAL
jgi:hypothetical protein